MNSTILSWGENARVVIEGVSSEEAHAVATRWCGSIGTDENAWQGSVLRLQVPPAGEARRRMNPKRIRIGARWGSDREPGELRVGPHAVMMGSGDRPDVIRFSSHRPPSWVEHGLVIDLGVNHLLARQGLPVVHACAFEVAGVGVLGLGESFSGKTTASVAAMRAGGVVVSDDALLVVPGEAGVSSLFPVRSFGWLRGRTREIVPIKLQDKMVETDENGQPRWVLNREDGGDGFINQSTPDVVWVQSVDRRLKESRIEAIDHGHVFAALIRASSPLYLSRHCPEIRDKLIPVFRALCEQCRGFRVRLGRRLLDDPVGEMERLVDLSR